MNAKNKKNKVVKSWVHDQSNDPYVRLAKKEGYRSRAAYKLLDIHQKYNILSSGNRVIDLGCAPGSWSQVALELVGNNGYVLGVDLLPIKDLLNLNFIQGDFTTDEIITQIISYSDATWDVVLSDMSPNLTGIKMVDQARSVYLIELVLDFAKQYLKTNGFCIMKAFYGGEFAKLQLVAKSIFKNCAIYKPDSSRSKSSEVYLICQNKL